MSRSQAPDLILHNAKVVTVDRANSMAQALAVKDGRFVAVDRNDAILPHADAHTTVLDGKGRTVVPGLIDGHAHMDREGLKAMVYPSLEGAASIGDIQDRIASLARQAGPGEWIVTMPVGDPPSYFDVPDTLAEKRYPNRRDLDEAAPDNPVYIKAVWGPWRHILPLVSIANSRALEAAGITRDTLSPCPSVVIEKDPESGEPTGIFTEDALFPIVELSLMRAAGGFDAEQRRAGLVASMRLYNAVGTTSVVEEHGAAAELIRAYQSVNLSGEAKVRAHLFFSPSWNSVAGAPIDALLASWGGWLGGQGLGDAMLRVSGMFADIGGGIEDQVRARANPYTGWAGFHYDSGLPRDRLKAVLIEAARNGIRVGGIRPAMLELYEEVDREVSIRDQRWVLGHLSVLTGEQVHRARDLGLIVTTHTNRYILRQGHLLKQQLGPANENHIVPLRRLLEAGVPLALATDNVPISLWHPVWQTVARENRYTGEVIAPDQRLTREEALRCATMGGAALTFEEGEKGSIEPGKLADFAVLSDDPLTCDEAAIRDIRADLTVVGGRVVYEREPD
jgi:predicted amidohydrolase YtcJ